MVSIMTSVSDMTSSKCNRMSNLCSCRLAAKAGLESASQGTGSERRVSLHAQGHAPAKVKPPYHSAAPESSLSGHGSCSACLMLQYVQPVASEALGICTKIMYALAKEENLTVSRDELAEMLDSGTLTQDLLKLWDTKGAEQETLHHMNSAASKGHLEVLKVAGFASLCASKAAIAQSQPLILIFFRYLSTPCRCRL